MALSTLTKHKPDTNWLDHYSHQTNAAMKFDQWREPCAGLGTIPSQLGRQVEKNELCRAL